MALNEYYGSSPIKETSVETKNQTTISYSDKEVYVEIPANARINKRDTNIEVREIENGWLKTICVYTYYSIQENDGDWEDKWHDSRKTYFSKSKPIDIQLAYSV